MRILWVGPFVLAAGLFTLFAPAYETTFAADQSPSVEGGTDFNAHPDKASLLRRLRQIEEELRRTRAELEQLKGAPPAGVTASPPLPIGKEEERPELDEEQARLERERAIRSVQRSGVLLNRGAIEAEVNFTYSHFSSNLISIDGFAILPVLVVGNIESLRIERDIYQPALTLRYGVLSDVQVDVSVPFRFERDRFVRQASGATPREQSIRDQGIGDVEFGLSYQLLYEQGRMPDMILSARVRAPTGKSQFDIPSVDIADQTEIALGSGVWGVRAGITAIKSLDPAILIFTGGYTHHFSRDIAVQVFDPETEETAMRETTFKPGEMVDYGVAVAVAMNPEFAINLQVQQRITSRTKLSGIGRVEGSSSNQADFRFGFAWAFRSNAALNFTAAAGLTEDTPDLSVSLSMPIKF